jgi:AcrR family transcriptional regulator
VLKPVPGARAQQREQTRAAILEAAITVFAARGFEGAAMSAIAARAAAPTPLIVYHFTDKERLWKAAVEVVFGRVWGAIEARAGELAGLEGRAFYRAAIGAQVHAIAAHPEYLRILFHEGAEESPRLAWLVERCQRPLNDLSVSLIAKAQSEGVLAAGVEPQHAKFILGGAVSLVLALAPEYRLTTGQAATGEDFLERHIDAVAAMLFRTPPAQSQA